MNNMLVTSALRVKPTVTEEESMIIISSTTQQIFPVLYHIDALQQRCLRNCN